jgi:hypothetical protein
VTRVWVARGRLGDTDAPAFLILRPSGRVEHARRVSIEGPSELVHDPAGRQLNGSTVHAWIETESEVVAE